MRNSLYSVAFDEALEAVGGHDRYQFQLLLLALVFSSAIGATLQSLDFMTLDEAQKEGFGEGNPWEFEPVKDLFFLGMACGALLFGVLVDLMGRRKCLQITVFLAMVSSAVISASLDSILLFLFAPLSGCSVAGSLLSMVLAVVEVTDSLYRLRTFAVVIRAVVVSYSVLGLVGLLLLKWRVLWMVAALFWACCLPLTQYLLESPRYLAVVIGKYSQARVVLQEIAAINQKPAFNGMLEGEKVIGYQEPSAQEVPDSTVSNPDVSRKLAFSPITTGIVSVSQGETTHVKRYFYWDLAVLGSVRAHCGGCGVLWVCLTCAQCSLVQGNERLLEYGAAVGVVVGCWGLLLLAQRIGRVHTMLLAFIFTGISALTGLILTNSACHSPLICKLHTVFSISASFAALIGAFSAQCIFLLYTIERFPSAIRSLILATALALWAAINSLFPFVQSLLVNFGLNAVLLSSLVLLCACPLLCLLRETLGEDLSDYVQEEQEEMKKPADLSQIEVRNPSPLGTPQRQGNPFSFEPINEEH